MEMMIYIVHRINEDLDGYFFDFHLYCQEYNILSENKDFLRVKILFHHILILIAI